MILLADANVLIDLWHVKGLHVLTKIAPTEVLDVVLVEVDELRHPGLLTQIDDAGIRVITTEYD